MSKYNLEIKLQVVADYEAGAGSYKQLAEKYQIGKSDIKRWIHNYQDFGIDGLHVKTTKRHYTVETKLNAIELYLNTMLSYREVGKQFGINNPSLIANWLRTFKREGIDGLSKSPGRPPPMSKQKNYQPKQNSVSLENENDVLKKIIEEQEARITQLDIENKFLKELRRLRETDKRQPDNKQ